MAQVALEGLKVVTAQEMARVEKVAYGQGASDQTFMENAGSGIAQAAVEFAAKRNLPKTATLLIGKGNKGGDAFCAGAHLIEKGFDVEAIALYPMEEWTPLCKKMHDRFRDKKGKVRFGEVSFAKKGFILDGLVGTGFYGKAEGALADAIEKANRSGLPILSIDIPSGVNGNTGEVGSVAIQAQETIFLGMPKAGFFLRDGWNFVGKLRGVDFGLGEKAAAQAKASAYLLNEKIVPGLFPPIKRNRHKYQAGYVLAIAGSPGMPGAAILSSFATLRSGAGIVRLFHPPKMQTELSSAPWELIREEWNGKDLKRIKEEAARAKAMLIGPGMGRTKEAKKTLQRIIKAVDVPMVVDADALFLLSEWKGWELPQGSILTPHHREMQFLLSKKSKGEINYLELCQVYAQEKGATIVLKGAPTVIFHPGTQPLIVTRGDPGMATAGSGDVLTGVIAGLLAQGMESRNAAALAVYLHGCAGEEAASTMTSYCMTSSDLIEFLPDAFGMNITS